MVSAPEMSDNRVLAVLQVDTSETGMVCLTS